MIIEIDTIGKTIKVKEGVIIGDLLDMLEKLLKPEWREFKLIPNNEAITYTYPIQYPYNDPAKIGNPYFYCENTCNN